MSAPSSRRLSTGVSMNGWTAGAAVSRKALIEIGVDTGGMLWGSGCRKDAGRLLTEAVATSTVGGGPLSSDGAAVASAPGTGTALAGGAVVAAVCFGGSRWMPPRASPPPDR